MFKTMIGDRREGDSANHIYLLQLVTNYKFYKKKDREEFQVIATEHTVSQE
jgi:hypothetical protein